MRACEVADAGGLAAFDPEDDVGVFGFEEELEVLADVASALDEAFGFVHLFYFFELGFEALDGGERAEIDVAVGLEEGLALGELHAALLDTLGFAFDGERGEEHAGAILDGGAKAFDGTGGGFFGAQDGFDVAGELVETGVRKADTEVVGGYVFELVGLVEDDGGGLGQDAGVGCAGGLELDVEVGEEEVVIDDDEVGLLRFAAHLRDEAVFPVGAGGAETGFGAGVELGPKLRRFGQVVEFGAVAVEGGLFPGGDVVELLDFVEAGK